LGFWSDKPSTINVSHSNLEVNEGQSISLVGGDICVENGTTLTAPSGQINLFSIGSSGKIILDNNSLKIDDTPKLGDIRISSSNLDVSGLKEQETSSGGVNIHCGNLEFFESTLLARSYGDSGNFSDVRIFVDSIFTVSEGYIKSINYGKGKGTDIDIIAKELKLENGSIFFTRTAYEGDSTNNSDSGKAGDISITGNLISISGVKQVNFF